ncbi:helix-turn-helix domain-containing protein [Halobacillus amylolyticus]|uniref:Helix-turn-helix domain-containing protein n=1 Tax=Halobacillus amylolyticus TaxID=2932259 RepID=A0ABY4HFU5_9BACI|nr:helix-turn-helix transcriptional regulator [Halobacillus amylolyticus]UOR13795.1 helix-turn-helix domain-containing protein [Halobacillus amylolyticus]
MIGNNIHNIRKSKGLSLSGLAKKANISKSYLSNIERNVNKNPSIQMINKIASVLDVEINALLKQEPSLEPSQRLEYEWIQFVNELKESGVQKDQLQEYKGLIEFIKWRNHYRKE